MKAAKTAAKTATVYNLDHFRKPKPLTPAQVRAWQEQNKARA